jgi:hypothetical protein
MNKSPILYGPSSPFSADEREVIEAIYPEVVQSGHANGERLATAIMQQMVSLERLGEVLAQYPSPLGEQTLGQRQRGLDTLIDALCRTTAANFEFFQPTRALLGRAMDMAESNFYRLLRHVCHEVLPGARGSELGDRAARCQRMCLYTKLVEEVLSAIASDPHVDRDVRAKAVAQLAQLWERRLTYSVSEFFPLLESTWEARSRIGIVGGTLIGTHEMFELFQAGADPRFVDYFGDPDHSENEVQAFREFLFGTSFEELDRLSEEMAAEGVSSLVLKNPMISPDHDATTAFYEFFRSRHLLATARKLANLPGPKRTAEEYAMVFHLRTSSDVPA